MNIDDPRLRALMNVAVLTPVTWYWARGKRPPDWLVVGSLAWAGVLFARDLQILLSPPKNQVHLPRAESVPPYQT